MRTQGRILTGKRVLLALLGAIGVFALYAAYSIHRTVTVVIPHSYAAWTTGDLLVEYLKRHTNQWPREWSDLAEARDSLRAKGRNIYWDFDKLPAIVKIDWNAEPAELAATALAKGESAVRVVTQLDGSRLEANWGPDTEPNRKVIRYLIQKYSAAEPGLNTESGSPTNR